MNFLLQVVLAFAAACASAAYNGPLAGGLPAHQYPAGVSPQACPNFPHCTNPAVAANPAAPAAYAAPAYNQIPAYNAAPAAYNHGAYNPAPAHYGGQPGYGQKALDNGEYTGDGDYKGEGLLESGAFGPVGKKHQKFLSFRPKNNDIK